MAGRDVIEDSVPMEARYRRRAEAAWVAARAAVGVSHSTAGMIAKIEAAGRIAAALLTADGDGGV